MRRELVQQYTEDEYTFEELVKLFSNIVNSCRKEGVSIEFVTHKPVYDSAGNIIGTTTDFPAELNVYKL